MLWMFLSTSAFNQPLALDTSKVTTMRSMFSGAAVFNQPLSFDVSSVTSMSFMFQSTNALSDCNKRAIEDSLSASTAWAAAGYDWSSFACFTPTDKAELRAALDAWNVDACAPCAETYGPVATWSVTAVTDFGELLSDLTSFNEALTGWDTSNAVSMRFMFDNATSFNQPLALDSGKVTDMGMCFRGATAYNQTLDLDTSSVVVLKHCFQGAVAFNKPLAFDVSSVNFIWWFMAYAGAFNQPLDFDTGKVGNMAVMVRLRFELRAQACCQGL
jgi:hypothetical protein